MISKQKVEDILNTLPEVEWDRFVDSPDGKIVRPFGWIRRPDLERDFVQLYIEELPGGHVVCQAISTSSAKFSREFAHRLGFEVDDHRDCKLVEQHFSARKFASGASPLAGATEALKIVTAIDKLRADEGASVTLCCDNPEPEHKSDNNKVIVCCAATSWDEVWVGGESHIDALENAVREVEERRKKMEEGR